MAHKQLFPDLSAILGVPSAAERLSAEGERRLRGEELSLEELMQSPFMGFAGITKGPGPKLRLFMGGKPAGVQRTTRMQPRAPMRQKVVEFPRGGQANQAVRREQMARLLGRGRRSLLGEKSAKNARPLSEKASLIVSRRGGRITFDTMRDDFVVRNKEFFDGGPNGKMRRFTTLDKAEDFILSNKKWFGPELSIFRE